MFIPPVIYFDLDNTLVDHTAAMRSALADLCDRFPDLAPDVPIEEVHATFDAINEWLWKEYAAGTVTGDEVRLRRLELLVESFAEEGTALDIQELSDLYIDRYVASTVAYSGVEQMLQALHTNHTLGVITNGFMEVQKQKLAVANLDRFFAHVISSEEVGVHKPDPRIFGAAIDAVRAFPENVLYVGDNFFHDMRGAAAAGMQTVWYNPLDHDHPQEYPEVRPGAVARSISELASILGASRARAISLQ